MRKIWFIIIILLQGCATTTITSFTDPDFKNKAFSNFIILTPNIDLQYGTMLQSKLCEKLKEKKIKCVEAYTLFFPTKEFTLNQKNEMLAKNNIDAYLEIQLGNGNVDLPQASAMTFGNPFVYNNSVAYPTFGVTPRRREAGYNIILMDVKTETKVSGQGREGASDHSFSDSLAAKIVEVLQQNGLI